MEYTEYLLVNNRIELLDPYTTAKAHHRMRCLVCDHEWSSTPQSKKQSFQNHNTSGCPNCNYERKESIAIPKRQANLQYLKDKGIEVLCGWDGRRADSAVKPIKITVCNTKCGHTFNSTSTNVLSRNVECSVCGKKERSDNLTQTSLDRSTEWQKTAPEWLAYKAKVTSHTTFTYNMYKDVINPNNYPRGIAGTEGAYHLDHIVPIRWCFDNNVPVHIAAHHTNLQIIPWLENVSEGGTLKEGTNIPVVLLNYL